jgi:phasin
VDTGSREENASKQNGLNLGNVSELPRTKFRWGVENGAERSTMGNLRDTQPNGSRATETAHRRETMSEEGRDRFEIPKEMRSMAEASVDQARKAFEKFVASAQQTAGAIEARGATVRASAKDISAKAISYAEKNMQASLDYAQALLHAKDLSEVMRLHSEYVRSQMRSLAEQASEMGQAVSRAAMDAAKPKS